MPLSIQRINPKTLLNASELGYSQISVVTPGRMAYISGQTGVSVDDKACPDDIVEQAKNATHKLSLALAALSATSHDLVQVRIYVTEIDLDTAMEFWPVVLEFFDGAEPSVAMYRVQEMIMPEVKISLEAVVRLPD